MTQLSVAMPVRDAMPYLRESVASILGQTHRDFEFVILDDASSDGSTEFLRERAAADPRIQLHRSDSPLGAVEAGNRSVALASAPLVARMDADDVSAPRRLERELEALASDRAAVAVGALADGIDRDGRRVRGRDRWRLVRRSTFPPFPHGSLMFRSDAFEAAGGYREQTRSWHDVDLVLRLARLGRILVLPETLFHYRYRPGSFTLSQDAAALDGVEEMWRCMAELRRRGDYEDVLRGAPGPPPPVDAGRWFAHFQDAMRLWAGLPPASPPGADGSPPERLRRAWQRRHPASLRGALRLLVAARDAAAGLAIRDARVREWRYG